MTKILLTGYSGFTGKYVQAEAKRQGVELFCLSEDGSPSSKAIDLLNYPMLLEKVKEINPDAVVHLAALSHVQHTPASDFYAINIGGTRNLLQAILSNETRLRNCVFASSANIYGNSSLSDITEGSQICPVNDYGLSKKCMEEMLALWRFRLPITIARPFNYTGVGQSENFLVPKIVKAFKEKRQQLELGNIDISRDFSDVRFIADAYLSLAQQTADFQILNLCSGHATSIKEILNECSKLTGHKLNVISNPLYRRNNEIHTLRGSTKIMQKILGYTSPFTLKETLAWMLSS